MASKIHTARNVRFDHFINYVMWHRANARVWAGTEGLCFSWQGANGQTFAAFARGENVVIYRAMKAVWPIPPYGTVPTRNERQEKMQIGEYRNPLDELQARYQNSTHQFS